MKQSSIDLLRSRFEKYPIVVSGPVPEEEIDQAEHAVGVKLAPDYRTFVAEFGGAMVGAYPVFGLRVSEVMGGSDFLVEQTRQYRDGRWPPTEKWAVISCDGAGNPIGMTDDGKIWISDHDARVIEVIASSFEEFVLRLARGESLLG
ncbi:MAG: SMI1/KNR4 family protein [Myxococcota bacterium]